MINVNVDRVSASFSFYHSSYWIRYFGATNPLANDYHKIQNQTYHIEVIITSN